MKVLTTFLLQTCALLSSSPSVDVNNFRYHVDLKQAGLSVKCSAGCYCEETSLAVFLITALKLNQGRHQLSCFVKKKLPHGLQEHLVDQ